MANRHDGGKGDKPILPQNQEQFDKNWDAIFKKATDEEKAWSEIKIIDKTEQKQ